MSDLLSGLKNLGLGKLEGSKLFEEKKPKEKQERVVSSQVTIIEEKDLVYDRAFTCPVCDNKFTAKVMKTGKARLLGMDVDLKPKYEGIDAVKYDVQVCPKCKYAALTSYFPSILSTQAKLIRENISNQVNFVVHNDDIYTYEEALERYQLALACAIVKLARNSEKAYVCLRYAWTLRGYLECVVEEEEEERVKAQEQECLKNALEGFINARQKESLPICGMDQNTLDYLIAALAYKVNRDDVAAKMISGILTSTTATSRIKDKARGLKQLILDKYKKDNV
ncbi:MAG: DUF2225 domain-containing protein [Lachnospiraceae bacterium]|nr:DUF2225 domain-containing protein [Lachnospiraceae bacterium]